tara:strand:- start:669 stop:1001 length:333 start_codon:yes stop_codon:yes gene_type:complete
LSRSRRRELGGEVVLALEESEIVDQITPQREREGEESVPRDLATRRRARVIVVIVVIIGSWARARDRRRVARALRSRATGERARQERGARARGRGRRRGAHDEAQRGARV